MDCDFGVELRPQNSNAPMRGRLADLSLGGCYVETSATVPLRTKLDLVFWLGEEKITTSGVVICSDPGLGVGVKFVGIAKAASDRMETYINQQMLALSPGPSGLKRPAGSAQHLTGAETVKTLH